MVLWRAVRSVKVKIVKSWRIRRRSGLGMVSLPCLGDGNGSIIGNKDRGVQAEDEDQAQDNADEQDNRANGAVILQRNRGCFWFVEIAWCKHASSSGYLTTSWTQPKPF